MLLYGLLDRQLERVVEFYVSREAAERELAVLLHDEPQWDAELESVRVEFGGAAVRVERTPSYVLVRVLLAPVNLTGPSARAPA